MAQVQNCEQRIAMDASVDTGCSVVNILFVLDYRLFSVLGTW